MAQKSQAKIISFRPPIVTVLGHVDHGKTTLLDTIRKTNIAGREHGGITQQIGAYQIETPKGRITFIDTPGHEAFAKMRQRGAKVADIAVLVVAGNDGVMPQTIESINLIQKAKIPSIVAINKIDLPDINLDKIKKQLTKQDLILEEYGGEIPVIPISAKTGQGVDKLLDMILLLTELNQIKDDTGRFKAVVIESTLSKNKGAVATIIVRSGKLSLGEEVICEDQEFKIRAFTDWHGQNRESVTASDPAETLGWHKVPVVGSVLYKKKELELLPSQNQGIQPVVKSNITTITESPQELAQDRIKLIIKSDNSGSLEAILGSLPQNVLVVSTGVGQINESDILLAKTAKAIVLGFNLKIADSVTKLAQSEKVILKTYNIIYELIEEIDDVVTAALSGNLVEILGEAKIIAAFSVKDQHVAGVKVTSGRIARGDKVKIVRIDEEIGRSRIKSLRHGKEDITKAEQGVEAGVVLADNLAFLTGDSIISIG